LKLRVDVLLKRYILAPALIHMVLVIPLTAAVIMLAGYYFAPLSFDNATAPWTLALALSFSSTVFAIKIFDERGEGQSFHAAIAIGVLVIQDVIAVAYLVAASGTLPSVWTLMLVPLFIYRHHWYPWVKKLLCVIGHGELQLLFGFAVALAAYALFELLHLKGGLGALVAGAVIAGADRERAGELYKRLLNIKNLLLVGFFLQIGYAGLPSAQMLIVAAALLVVLTLRPIIYFTLFTVFRLRARTATLAGIGLTTYSEFGLIVASIAASEGWISNEWLVTLALAIALSFFVATPLNSQVHRWFLSRKTQLQKHEKERLPEEQVETISDARVVLLGMGRVGRDAYQYLQTEYPGQVVGVEENFERTEQLKAQGFRCVHGDASDRDFWERACVADCDILLVSLSSHREHLAVVNLAHELKYSGMIAVTSRFEDERAELELLGCVGFNLYADVGRGFAEAVMVRHQK
jgi:predicted Kef-type K+ transport protein